MVPAKEKDLKGLIECLDVDQFTCTYVHWNIAACTCMHRINMTVALIAYTRCSHV